MIGFLDIEGAFSNIQPQAILNELDHINYLDVGSLRQHWVPKPS